ncbi:helix-turn-helix transcriptional regulator [Kutzneria chonburiensis]|uniref:LuxR C-terminal-related transcriptional regulator n=1 Tax=Kutzneria chonburiensis TaxID=1483604 RepID=A0ABV6MN48_9PSEU|nr:LuxR C-terminal-related transcriptional regulator [Kutzneria chonburiensis]
MHSPPDLRPIGREAECARVVAAVSEGRREFRALLVLGGVGSGKTAVLATGIADATAQGTRVLHVRANAAEAEVPFGALHQLLAVLGNQPAWSEVAGEDVAAALVEAGLEAPLLLAVDDAEHLDRHSARLLGHIGRHTSAVPITLLISARRPPVGIGTTMPVLQLSRLTDADAARLADAQPHRPSGRTRLRILREAAGNPLAIVELCRAHAGGRGFTRIRQMLDVCSAGLPDRTRSLVLRAATGATAVTPADLMDWKPAETAGLVRLEHGEVRFEHPLAATACYWRATAAERQQAHLDIARDGATPADRQAWHLGQACLASDETVAAALEATAPEQDACAEAEALQRAAECSPEPAQQVRRYLGAMAAADRLGAPAWVRELHTELLARTDDPQALNQAARHVGQALSLAGRQREAFAHLHSRVSSDGIPVLSEIAFRSGLPDQRTAVAELLPDIPDQIAQAVVRVRTEPWRALELTDLPVPAEPSRSWLTAVGEIAWYADESAACVSHLAPVFTELVEQDGVELTGPWVLHLMQALLDTGAWDTAATMLTTLANFAGAREIVASQVWVAALRGELAAKRGAPAPNVMDCAWRIVPTEENRAGTAMLRRAAGLAALAVGDCGMAYRHLRALFGADVTPLHPALSHRSIVELVEAGVRVGEHRECARLLGALQEQPEMTARQRLRLGHAAALLGDGPDTEGYFVSAVANPRADQWPFDHALAQLHFAEWLRRQRRSVEARPLFTTALETFSELGAALLVHRTRGELRACGGDDEESGNDRLSVLSAQQRRVVQLVATGMRNQDVAARLLLSARTVDSHLREAYAKLGISNRHQLRSVVEC